MQNINTKVDNIIEKEEQEKATKEAVEKHKKKSKKLFPFPCSEGKTVFYCSSKERGERAVKAYESKLTIRK